jgi:hypothetical protein
MSSVNFQKLATIATIFKITLVIYVFAFCLKLNKGAVISSVLVVEYGLSELFAFWIEKSVAILLLFCLIGVFFKSTYNLSLGLISIFLVFYSLLSYANGGKAFLELSLISAISKWWLPILTMISIHHYYLGKAKFNRWFLLAIQFSIFLIFLSHGIGCFLKNGVYIDYILGFFNDFTTISMKQKDAEQLLNIIGVVDVAVAVLVLIKASNYLLYWLIFWGFLTAMLRVLDASILNYVEFLIRVPHFGLPLVLLFIQNYEKETLAAGSETLTT